jgi:hypothetical protein
MQPGRPVGGSATPSRVVTCRLRAYATRPRSSYPCAFLATRDSARPRDAWRRSCSGVTSRGLPLGSGPTSVLMNSSNSWSRVNVRCRPRCWCRTRPFLQASCSTRLGNPMSTATSSMVKLGLSGRAGALITDLRCSWQCWRSHNRVGSPLPPALHRRLRRPSWPDRFTRSQRVRPAQSLVTGSAASRRLSAETTASVTRHSKGVAPPRRRTQPQRNLQLKISEVPDIEAQPRSPSAVVI